MASEQVWSAEEVEKGRDATAGDERLLKALVGTVLLSLVLAAVTLAFWNPTVGFVFASVLVLGVEVAGLAGWRQVVERDERLALLALAVERGAPLAATFESLAGSQRGGARRRLLALARILNQGAPLPEALAVVPGVLPDHARVAIGLGWPSGRLAGVLRQAVESRRPDRVVREALAPRAAHLAGVLLLIKLIVSFVLYFILPKYEAIFKDFGVELPRITIVVILASHWLTRWGWPFVVGLTIAELVLIGLLPFYLAGWLPTEFFWSDRLFPSRHRAPLLRALGWVAAGEKPLTTGVLSMIRYYPSRWVQERLILALQDCAGGDDFWQALRRRKLIGAADVALLESAQRVGHLPWALEQAADAAERRSLIRIQAAAALASTLGVVALGALALVLALAFFVPLVTLIERLSS